MARRASTPHPYFARIIMGNGRIYWGEVDLIPDQEVVVTMTNTPHRGPDVVPQEFRFVDTRCDPGHRPFLSWVMTTVGRSVCTQEIYRPGKHRNLTNSDGDPVRRYTRDQHRHRAPKGAQMRVTLFPRQVESQPQPA